MCQRKITPGVLLLCFDYHTLQPAVVDLGRFSLGCQAKQAIKVNRLLCILFFFFQTALNWVKLCQKFDKQRLCNQMLYLFFFDYFSLKAVINSINCWYQDSSTNTNIYLKDFWWTLLLHYYNSWPSKLKQKKKPHFSFDLLHWMNAAECQPWYLLSCPSIHPPIF